MALAEDAVVARVRGQSRGRRARLKTVRVGLLGYGRIGQAVAALAERERDVLGAAGLDVRVASALVRDLGKHRPGPALPLTTQPGSVLDGDVDLVVEVLGGEEPARALVTGALDRGLSVVTANKTLVARHGADLRALAARRGATLAFDAAVLAGVPFVGSLARRPLMAAVERIAGIVNGTSHFLLGELERGASFAQALAEARARGYAEPDASADTSGRDAAEKLAILLHLAGRRDARAEDLFCASLDVIEPADLAAARLLGGAIKPLARASLVPGAAGAWVGPAFVTGGHPFVSLAGVTNALQLTRAGGQDIFFAGPGAGPDATAATIIDDIVETIGGSVCAAAEFPGRYASRSSAAALHQPAAGRWFVRAAGAGVEAVRIAERLAARGVPAVRIVSTADRVVALTPPAAWPSIRQTIAALEASGANALALPVVDC